MRKPLLLLAAGWLSASGLLASEPSAPKVPFQLPLPASWKAETIPFPLDFAPQISYRGVEELRFSPGMFKPGERDFWTYAFVWWLEGKPELTTARLQDDLKAYFVGLSRSDPKFDSKKTPIGIHLEPGQEGERVEFHGTVETFDPFKTHAPVRLNVRIVVAPCVKSTRTAVLFRASPQPPSDSVWSGLDQIVAGFRCSL